MGKTSLLYFQLTSRSFELIFLRFKAATRLDSPKKEVLPTLEDELKDEFFHSRMEDWSSIFLMLLTFFEIIFDFI